jgi:hypothetical protein
MIDYKISPGTAGNSDIPDRYDDLPSHNIEVFQSENVQNILDAKSKNKDCVEIYYDIKKLAQSERQNLRSLLGINFFDTLKRSFDKCEAQDIEQQVEKIKLALQNEDKWYSLIITEKNTTGLLGDETGKEKGSKYNALVRHTNKSVNSEVSGGTFGKGSSVYTYSSGLWLWFAYTVLETPWKDDKVRFSGRGMIAPFIDRDGNRSYDGPLWYARRETPNEFIGGNPQQGLPYVGKEAHKEAQNFGIPLRDENDPGTTYLIPVFWPEGIGKEEMNAETISRELKNEIIKRWFVPIYTEKLKCFINIVGDEDTRISITKKDLFEIPELKYKIEILEWYINGADKEDKRFRQEQIKLKLPVLIRSQQKIAEERFGKKIGHKENIGYLDLVVRILSEDEKNFKGFLDEEKIGTVNRVGLIRNKGMIVNHYPYHSKYKEDFKKDIGENNFEAILFAGKINNSGQSEEVINHMEMFLSYAENPAHDEWIHNDRDLNRCHLKRFEDRPFPVPVSRVYSIFNRLYGLVAELFPKDDKPPEKNEICQFWRKLYKLPGAGDDKGGKRNFDYETLQEGFDREGRYMWKLKVLSTVPKKVKLEFGHYINTLEGAVRGKDEYSNLGISEFDELFVMENGTPVQEILLEFDNAEEKGIPKEIEVKTCRLTSNNLFKNMNPVLEITDTIIDENGNE